MPPLRATPDYDDDLDTGGEGNAAAGGGAGAGGGGRGDGRMEAPLSAAMREETESDASDCEWKGRERPQSKFARAYQSLV